MAVKFSDRRRILITVFPDKTSPERDRVTLEVFEKSHVSKPERRLAIQRGTKRDTERLSNYLQHAYSVDKRCVSTVVSSDAVK